MFLFCCHETLDKSVGSCMWASEKDGGRSCTAVPNTTWCPSKAVFLKKSSPLSSCCAKSRRVIWKRAVQPLPFIRLACSPPNLLRLWPRRRRCRRCRLQPLAKPPAVPTCTEKAVSRCRSAVTDSTDAVGEIDVCADLRSAAGGEHELELLTLDVYCIFSEEILLCEFNF